MIALYVDGPIENRFPPLPIFVQLAKSAVQPLLHLRLKPRRILAECGFFIGVLGLVSFLWKGMPQITSLSSDDLGSLMSDVPSQLTVATQREDWNPQSIAQITVPKCLEKQRHA